MNVENVVELALELVNTPSVSGEETPLCDKIERALRAVSHLDVRRDGDAIVARTHLGRKSRILFAGHLDTVPFLDNFPGELRRSEGILWGRGSVDMKAGDAVFVHLACTVAQPRVDCTWVFYDHEEVEASLNGLGRIARNHPEWLKADLAVLGEPTNAAIEGGCNGTLRVRVHSSGVAAHSARPWMGENAVHRLLPALQTIASWEPQVHRVGGLDFKESLLAVGIGGGTGGNSVPHEAHLIVNFRFAPDRSPREAEAYVRGLLPGYEIEVTDSAPGARPGMEHEEFSRLASILHDAGAPRPSAKLGWTDVARFSQMGIPAINCGPGDPLLAHMADEACPLEQIEGLAKSLRLWIA